jgi:hypothetical protein
MSTRQQFQAGGGKSLPTIVLCELPSWLASAVVHMALLLVLGLLLTPAHDVRVIDFTLAFSDAVRGDAEQAPASVAVHGSSQAAARLKRGDPIPRPAPAAAPTEVPPRRAPQASPSTKQSSGPQLAAATLPSSPPVIEPSPSRGRSASGRLRGTSAAAARYARLEGRGDFDGIVERFSQADVGLLTGAAGQRAKYEFGRLGESAIPALVRGLNRSTKFSESCPVLVISKKLDELLAKTDDPYLLLYALENVGRGVHPRAHHWQQLVAKRNEWLKKYGERVAPLSEQLAEELHPQRTLEGGGPFTAADADELALAVTHPDAAVRRQALAAIAARGMAFGDAERFEMAQPLIAQLSDKDASVRHLARQTLIALSGGREMGPSEEELDRDPAAAAVWWRDRWTLFGLSQTLGNRGAKLVEALSSMDRPIRVAALADFTKSSPILSVPRRIQAARALIRLLADEEDAVRQQARAALVELADGVRLESPAKEPNENPAQSSATSGQAAEIARWTRHWNQIELHAVATQRADSLLAMARTLEERGRSDDAHRYYQRIASEYPDTNAAALARAKIESSRDKETSAEK